MSKYVPGRDSNVQKACQLVDDGYKLPSSTLNILDYKLKTREKVYCQLTSFTPGYFKRFPEAFWSQKTQLLCNVINKPKGTILVSFLL